MEAIRKFAAANAERVGPLLYLFVCLIAFGLFIPFLGFFWDDWPTIFYTFNDRVGQLINHFSYDRPFSVWAYWLVGRLGTSPIVWQLATLALTWASIVALAWALKPLWKQRYKKILYIGLLFAIYPGYAFQPSAVIFVPHLAALALYLVSLGAMGRAVTDKARFWQFTALGLAAAAAHMFTVEYFVGLEFVRPVYLWILLANQKPDRKPDLARIGRLWLPYLGIFAAWMAWRLFFLKLPVEPYPLVMASDLRSDPLAALAHYALVVLNDMQTTLIHVWTALIQPMFDSLGTGFGLMNAGISLATGAVVYAVLQILPSSRRLRNSRRLNTSRRQVNLQENDDAHFARQGMLLGASAFLFGMLPVWAIGETISQGDYNLRYILVAMFGAAVLVASLVVLFVPERHHRNLIFSLLVVFAVGSHLFAANEYRLDWQKQRTFYWQLRWRAPAFEEDTALVSFDRVSTYLGDPMTGNALNVLYPLDSAPPAVDLWNFELNRTQTVNSIKASEILQNDYRGLTFSTQTAEDLVFYYLPENGCLWVLSPFDINNEYLPFDNRELVSHSNLGNILPDAENDAFPPQHIFGAEPAHTWCYYYEKAELARWQGDWAGGLSLMAEAEELGLSPNYGVELLPLVEAQAASGDWARVVATSERIHNMHARNDSLLCGVWLSLAANGGAAGQEAYAQVQQIANCQIP